MTNWPRNATHPTVFPASLLLLPLALLPPPPSVTPLFLTFPAPLSRRAGPTRLILPRGSLAPLSSAPPLELRFTPSPPYPYLPLSLSLSAPPTPSRLLAPQAPRSVSPPLPPLSRTGASLLLGQELRKSCTLH
jgi:hypothetical protein